MVRSELVAITILWMVPGCATRSLPVVAKVPIGAPEPELGAKSAPEPEQRSQPGGLVLRAATTSSGDTLVVALEEAQVPGTWDVAVTGYTAYGRQVLRRVIGRQQSGCDASSGTMICGVLVGDSTILLRAYSTSDHGCPTAETWWEANFDAGTLEVNREIRGPPEAMDPASTALKICAAEPIRATPLVALAWVICTPLKTYDLMLEIRDESNRAVWSKLLPGELSRHVGLKLENVLHFASVRGGLRLSTGPMGMVELWFTTDAKALRVQATANPLGLEERRWLFSEQVVQVVR